MKRAILILAALLIIGCRLSAHVINYELDKISHTDVFFNYILIGFAHIIPMGLDHILFILCVFFLNTSLKKIILQASMFTLAHSITLGLAMYKIINPPPGIIEPLIALSIVMLAVENIFSQKVKPWRMVMVFVFGLVHGMGFASALSRFGLPASSFATGLIGFNIGVESGQLLIILFMHFMVARSFSQKYWYRKFIVIPSSVIIALVASYWTIERFMLSY